MRKHLIIGFVISAGLMALVFWKTDLDVLWRACQSANYWYFLPSVGITFACFWLRAVRWQLLFAPIKKVNLHPLFSATMIGFMANNLLPARLGEFVRAYVIGKQENVAKSASFGTIVVERVFDGLVLLSLLITVFLTNSSLPDWVVISGYVATLVYLVALGFLIVLEMRRDWAAVLLGRVLAPISRAFADRVLALLDSFAVGLQVLRRGKRLAAVIVLSFVHWVVFGLTIYFALLAFNLHLPFAVSLLVMSILGFAVTVPSSPGFIGTFHAACVGALALFSVSQSEALSFSIVYHASQYIPVTLVGLIYLWTDHLSLREISHADIAA